MGKCIIVFWCLLLGVQAKAQPTNAELEQVLRTICHEKQLMHELCKDAFEFKNQ